MEEEIQKVNQDQEREKENEIQDSTEPTEDSPRESSREPDLLGYITATKEK